MVIASLLPLVWCAAIELPRPSAPTAEPGFPVNEPVAQGPAPAGLELPPGPTHGPPTNRNADSLPTNTACPNCPTRGAPPQDGHLLAQSETSPGASRHNGSTAGPWLCGPDAFLGKTAADGDGTDSSPDPTRRPDEAPEPFVPTAGESPAETSPTRRADDPEDLDRDLAHRLYATEIALGWQHWKQGDVESLRQLLARQATRFQRGTTRDLRGFEWHYLHRLAHAEERVLPGDFPMVRDVVSLGAAGELLTLHRIATNTQPPEIRRWNLAEEEDSRPLDSNLGIDLDSVGCLAASADGQFLALASGKEVRVIQLLTSATLEIPTGHEDFVFCLAFSPDGERLASGSLDGKVRIWDRPTGTLVAEMDGGRQSDENPLGILSVAWSADGTRLVTGSGDDRAPVWFQRLHGELKLWDAQTAEAICTFQNVPSQVNCVAFAGDRWVLSGGFGGELLVWDVGTGGLVRRLGTQTGPIRSLAVIADPWRVAAACHDGTARVWQIETGEELAVTRGHRGAVSRVVWDAARGRLVTGGWDGTLRVWDVREPVERSNLGVHPWTILQTHHPVDGQSVITVDYHSARVFDSHTRRPLRTIHSGHWNVSSALTPDNRQLLLGGFSGPDGSGTGFVSLWSLETGERLAGFDPGAGRGIRVSVSRDGRWLAALGFSATRERDRLTLWELTPSGPGKRLGRWTVSASPVFTPDSRSLVFAQPEGLARYSLVDQQLQKPLPEGSRQFTQLAVAPDSQRLAATDEAGDLTLWNLSDGQVVQRGPVHAGPVGRLLFSPKGDTLITANRETTRLWTVAPFGLRAEIPRPACEMLVTPDNRTLITAWQTLDFWQLETGLPMLQLDDYQMEIPNCLSISPDGTLLSEGGGSRDENEGVYLWRAAPVSPTQERRSKE